MRVVFDTNVLVSSFISKHGLAADILDLVATFDEITLVSSDEILEEFREVMNRDEVRERFPYAKADISRFVRVVRDVAEIVKVSSKFDVVTDDPDDNVILSTAVDGQADYLVTGDRHLKKLKRFKGVGIVNPKAFMATITSMFGDLILSKEDLV